MLMNKSEYMKPEHKNLQRHDSASGCYTKDSPCYKGARFQCLTRYGQCVLVTEENKHSGGSDRIYDNLVTCERNCKIGEAGEEKFPEYSPPKYFSYRIDGDSCV